MAEPFLGEIRLFSFNFAPKSWALCNGQLLPTNQNMALFSLLGTNYGGNGVTNFALPDLRGRVPIHVGNAHTVGERGGEQVHTVSTAEMPAHTHALNGSSSTADVIAPTGNQLAVSSQLYGPPQHLVALDSSTNGSVGGSQSHLNMQPHLVLNFCIALQGIFPSQT